MNEKICPLCGKPNNCKAGTNELCWCHEVVVPSDLLKMVPEELQDKACICEECIEKYWEQKSFLDGIV